MTRTIRPPVWTLLACATGLVLIGRTSATPPVMHGNNSDYVGKQSPIAPHAPRWKPLSDPPDSPLITSDPPSFNIDFGTSLGAPPADFGAAGAAGVWNDVTGGPGVPQALVDLSGAATEVTVSYESTLVAAFDDPATAGDDERLMDDGLIGLGDVLVPITFEGLDDGVYDVIVYAWLPGVPADTTFVAFGEGGLDFVVSSGGPWPGEYADGVTHVVIAAAEVTGGALTISFGGGVFGATGFVNGIQLTPHHDPADLDHDGSVGFSDLLIMLGAWGACPAGTCPADLDGSGAVGFGDVLALISAWG